MIPTELYWFGVIVIAAGSFLLGDEIGFRVFRAIRRRRRRAT